MEKNIITLNYENGQPTGVIRYIQMLENGLAAIPDIKVHSIVLDSYIIFPELVEIDGIVTARLPFSIDSHSLRKELFWQKKYFNVVVELLTPYFKDKENIYWHVNDLFLCKFADILKSTLGGFIITHLHIIPWKFCLESDENLFNKMYLEYVNGIFDTIRKDCQEGKAYKLSDKIICVSTAGKQHIVSVYNVDPSKISVVFNGLTDELVPKYKRNNGPNCFEILFVGRVSKEKGAIGLLNALRKVRDAGRSFKLILAGHCSDIMADKIRCSYEKIDFEILGKVSFEKLCELYSTCTMGIIPSLHEQCSYVAIEMSMFGVPMIVSDVDALSEMFEDEVNALKVPLIFDPDFGLEIDEDRLATSVIRLMEDDVLRKKMSENAIKNYHDRFTLEQMIEKTMNLYQQLV